MECQKKERRTWTNASSFSQASAKRWTGMPPVQTSTVGLIYRSGALPQEQHANSKQKPQRDSSGRQELLFTGELQNGAALTRRNMFSPSAFSHPTIQTKTTNLHLKRESAGNTPTCFSGSSMNSSVLDTSTKCCSTYLCADLSRSLQECVSANPRMPRQFEGSSWLSRNLQHASRTPLSCSRLAAGSRV